VLIQLSPEARPEQVRFALAGSKEIKVISGTPLVTSVRQFLSAVLAGVLLFTGLMLLATLMQISVLYSAVLAERQQELGLLLALGAYRGQVARMVLAEAGLTTGLGGLGGLLLGAVLLLVMQHTLGMSLETLEVPLAWPSAPAIGLAALGCLAVAVAVGPLGAMLPAWQMCRRDPYNLARGGAA
jgi:putative ABC transport system permease protein